MSNARSFRITSIADSFGIMASTVCALHCILIPVLLVSGTVLPVPFLSDESFHKAMVWLILPTALLAFSIGCWRHKDRWVLTLGLVGLTGMILSATVVHDIVGETGERVVTMLSAAILIAAHYRNFRLCRSSDCDNEACTDSATLAPRDV